MMMGQHLLARRSESESMEVNPVVMGVNIDLSKPVQMWEMRCMHLGYWSPTSSREDLEHQTCYEA